eukprot:m.3579 g.3579  ORF g.3579 m.3579 type:complete len:103 (-) comp2091_c0_seq1:323-631(-)
MGCLSSKDADLEDGKQRTRTEDRNGVTSQPLISGPGVRAGRTDSIIGSNSADEARERGQKILEQLEDSLISVQNYDDDEIDTSNDFFDGFRVSTPAPLGDSE